MEEKEVISERRSNDIRLLRLEDKINDQDKAITTLTSTHQQMSFVLTNMQETLTEISHTLKKLADIEKTLVKYEIVEKDMSSKINTIEKVQNEVGCSNVRGLDKRVTKLEETHSRIVWGLLTAVGLSALNLLGLGK